MTASLQCLVFYLVVILFAICNTQIIGETHWDMLQTNFPNFYPVPLTESDALSQNWTILMECGEDTSPGNVYAFEDDLAAMPFYNADGNIAGIILGMEDPGALAHRAPYIPYTTSSGDTFWGIEANFRDPDTICTEGSTGNVTFGDRLWFANGSHTQYSKTPLTQKEGDLRREGWVLGACKPDPFRMGYHWWRYTSVNGDCNTSYPIFILYDDNQRLHAWGVAMGNSDRPSLTESARWEHPAGASLTSFWKEGEAPLCLAKQSDAYNSQHVYMAQYANTTCTNDISTTEFVTSESGGHKKEEKGTSNVVKILLVILFILVTIFVIGFVLRRCNAIKKRQKSDSLMADYQRVNDGL